MPRVALGVCALGFAAIVALSSKPPGAVAPGGLSVPNPQFVSVIGNSNIAMIADLYWIQMCASAVTVRTPERGKDFLAWANFVTDLDPRFYWAYMMGALVSTVQVGNVVHNAHAAAALLRKGLSKLSRFELALQLAYLQLLVLNHREDAAATLREGAQMTGAPPYLGLLATQILSVAGNYEAAETFAKRMVATGDATTKEIFEQRLRELQDQPALKLALAGQGALDKRLARRATLPELVASLRSDGQIPQETLARLRLDESGTVQLEGSKMLQVFIRPTDQVTAAP